MNRTLAIGARALVAVFGMALVGGAAAATAGAAAAGTTVAVLVSLARSYLGGPGR